MSKNQGQEITLQCIQWRSVVLGKHTSSASQSAHGGSVMGGTVLYGRMSLYGFRFLFPDPSGAVHYEAFEWFDRFLLRSFCWHLCYM